jgi:hypothetical protein
MPEHIVTVKKERKRARNALGETNNLARIQLPGSTKQELRTDRQHKCQKSQKKVNSGTHESGIKRSRLQHKVGAPKKP